jgi:MFS family permease
MTTRILNYIPNLPRRAWTVLAGDAFSALGSGFVLPFLIVYLHEVRHIDIEIAGLVLSTFAVSSLLFAPVTGTLVDRFGARRTLISSLIVLAVSVLAYALVRATWHAFFASGLFGIGISMMWPSIHSVLSSVVEPHQRSSVFSVHYATLNAGIGIGGITGGLLLDLNNPGTFEALFAFDALTFLAFAGLLLRLKGVGAVHEDGGSNPGSYRAVVGDKLFVRIFVLTTLLVTLGYAQLESAFPAFARDAGEISPEALGLAFGANTFTIVAAQLVVLKKLTSKRRTRALTVLCALWGASWAVTLGSGSLPAGVLASSGFALAMVLFALGETLVSPTLPAIVNDLATDATRGRYNAGYSFAFSLGNVIGPAIAGVALGSGLDVALFVGLIAGCGAAAWMALRLERHLPPSLNRMAEVNQEPADVTAEEAAVVA